MPSHVFKLKPSKYYLILLSVTVLVCFSIIVYLPLAPWLRGLSLVLLLGYGGYTLRTGVLLRGQQSITSIRFMPDGRWQVAMSGVTQELVLRGDSTVTTGVSVLRFQRLTGFWPHSCVIFRDSLGRERYRELLVVLRMLAR